MTVLPESYMKKSLVDVYKYHAIIGSPSIMKSPQHHPAVLKGTQTSTVGPAFADLDTLLKEASAGAAEDPTIPVPESNAYHEGVTINPAHTSLVEQPSDAISVNNESESEESDTNAPTNAVLFGLYVQPSHVQSLTDAQALSDISHQAYIPPTNGPNYPDSEHALTGLEKNMPWEVDNLGRGFSLYVRREQDDPSRLPGVRLSDNAWVFPTKISSDVKFKSSLPDENDTTSDKFITTVLELFSPLQIETDSVEVISHQSVTCLRVVMRNSIDKDAVGRQTISFKVVDSDIVSLPTDREVWLSEDDVQTIPVVQTGETIQRNPDNGLLAVSLVELGYPFDSIPTLASVEQLVINEQSSSRVGEALTEAKGSREELQRLLPEMTIMWINGTNEADGKLYVNQGESPREELSEFFHRW